MSFTMEWNNIEHQRWSLGLHRNDHKTQIGLEHKTGCLVCAVHLSAGGNHLNSEITELESHEVWSVWRTSDLSKPPKTLKLSLQVKIKMLPPPPFWKICVTNIQRNAERIHKTINFSRINSGLFWLHWLDIMKSVFTISSYLINILGCFNINT